MPVSNAVPLTMDADAAALVKALGMQSELERMLDHARQTIPGLQRLHVKFGPAYDSGAESVIIEAILDPSTKGNGCWSWDDFSAWKIATFSPDVYRHFTLLEEYGTGHGG